MNYYKQSIGNPSAPSLDDVCYLVTSTTEKDTIGNMIETDSEAMVFCCRLSVTRAEFNIAGQLGYKPDMMIVVDSDSYNQEKFLLYDNKKFTIYKTFQRVDGFTELYCEVKKGD